MNINYKKLDKLLTIIAILFLFINISFLVWYLFYGYRSGFHSDASVKVLVAREIFESGKYFPPDWYYVNGDLLVLFGNLFIVPLLMFMPAGFKAHAISGLISTFLILLSVWLVSALFQISLRLKIFIVAVFASGISGFIAENLYGQASYGTIFYITLFLIFFSIKALQSIGINRSFYLGAVFFLVLIISWANPQRAAASYLIPLIFSIFSIYIFNYNRLVNFRKPTILYIHLITALFFGFIAGAFFHFHYLSSVNNIAGAGFARWLTFEQMGSNLFLLFKGLLAIFGGIPTAGKPILSITGFYEFIRLICGILVIALVPIVIKNFLGSHNPVKIFFATFIIIETFIVLFFQIFSNVPDMSDPIQSSRYLIPSVLLIFLGIFLIEPRKTISSLIIKLCQGLIIIVFVTGSYITYFKSNVSSFFLWGKSPLEAKSNWDGIKNFLLENGLQYGYGTYWNAGVISVLSDEQVLIRQIQIVRGLPIPMNHWSSARWYRQDTWRGDSFLLLNQSEINGIDWTLMERYGLTPKKQLKFHEFYIYVFDENIAINLPDWDSSFINERIFYPSTRSFYQVGKLKNNIGSGGLHLESSKGEVGFMHFGPYVTVDPGKYRVTFDIISKPNVKDYAKIDIVSQGGKNIFAEAVLSDDGSKNLDIFVDKKDSLEFRVFTFGHENVILRNVKIKRLAE